MSLLKRFGYYLGGFALGLIILAFFLNKKKTTFSYGPEARVKKNIGIKVRHFSDEVSLMLTENKIDSLTISNVIKYGDVLFSKSKTKLDSCKIYVIEDELDKKNIQLTIENCDSIATIQKIDIKKTQ